VLVVHDNNKEEVKREVKEVELKKKMTKKKIEVEEVED